MTSERQEEVKRKFREDAEHRIIILGTSIIRRGYGWATRFMLRYYDS